MNVCFTVDIRGDCRELPHIDLDKGRRLMDLYV
jgi:hypothetical protein